MCYCSFTLSHSRNDKRNINVHTLIWNSSDSQSSIEMGVFATEAAAVDAIPTALMELLEQTADDMQEQIIRAGNWSVEVVA